METRKPTNKREGGAFGTLISLLNLIECEVNLTLCHVAEDRGMQRIPQLKQLFSQKPRCKGPFSALSEAR